MTMSFWSSSGTRLRPSTCGRTAGGISAPASAARVGNTSTWAASAPQSAGVNRPGQRQNELARVPPSHGVPFAPRMPAANRFTPTVPPLSFMNTTSVSRAMSQASSWSSSRPTRSSIVWIMP